MKIEPNNKLTLDLTRVKRRLMAAYEALKAAGIEPSTLPIPDEKPEVPSVPKSLYDNLAGRMETVLAANVELDKTIGTLSLQVDEARALQQKRFEAYLAEVSAKNNARMTALVLLSALKEVVNTRGLRILHSDLQNKAQRLCTEMENELRKDAPDSTRG